jgi:hypothetical protein
MLLIDTRTTLARLPKTPDCSHCESEQRRDSRKNGGKRIRVSELRDCCLLDTGGQLPDIGRLSGGLVTYKMKHSV